MEILIATKNVYKATEMSSFLEDLVNVKIHLLKDQDFEVEVEEDGKSMKIFLIRQGIQ